MKIAVYLDSGPLSILTQRIGAPGADAGRAWLAAKMSAGVQVFVPEVVDYELRRELLRAGKSSSVKGLDTLNAARPGRYIPLTTGSMRLAAQLWADVRRRGLSTADSKELDVDVILAAQVLDTRRPLSDIIVATSNPAHISRFVPADLWANI